MNNKLEIIKYTPKYSKALKTLIKEFQIQEKQYYKERETSDQKINYLLKEATSKTDQSILFLGLINNNVIGYTAGFREENENKLPCYYINDLFITKPYRKKGYGTHLLKHISSYAKEKGYKYLGIGVLHNNTKALELYKKIGFKNYGIELMKKI
ncbi:MAG TPA: GNAT family N-acetyltransferase [Candidatus Dojkabacteria bacterium]|nr:GNAT family N-acetyltransferase [Candidatus Dojkabacteria bacterium]